jgi:AcrR family transcriptional regulator
MPSSRNLTRQKLIRAAIELFATQGVTETTTKQIAELAQVNEVTLFRQFGNKHGLLLAVIEDAEVFAQLGQSLVDDLPQASDLPQMLRNYANTCLQALEHTPAVVRSLVGESAQYSPENRQALGRSFDRANRRVAKYLKTSLGESSANLQLPIDRSVSLLNTLLFGYITIELTSEYHELWRDRDDFLDNVISLFLAATSASAIDTTSSKSNDYFVPDLPAEIVDRIIERAKKTNLQTYAIAYVLFGSGVSASELVGLNRSHHSSASDRQSLQIVQGAVRQVPVDRWIMGKRYGSYLKNPLTQWLKSRKDTNQSLFIGADGLTLTETDLRQQWQQLTSEIILPTGGSPSIEQTRSTWCVEMLMRGVDSEAMQILTGWNFTQLEPYLRRAKEQAALLQVFDLDIKH